VNLTSGILPVANGNHSIANSIVTQSAGHIGIAGTLTVTGLTDSGLTPSRCVQTGAGGILTVAAGVCGTSGSGTQGGTTSASHLVGASGANTLSDIPGTVVDFTQGNITIAPPATGTALTITGAPDGSNSINTTATFGIFSSSVNFQPASSVLPNATLTDSSGFGSVTKAVNAVATVTGSNVQDDGAIAGQFFATDTSSAGAAGEVYAGDFDVVCTGRTVLCAPVHIQTISGTIGVTTAGIIIDPQGGNTAIKTDPGDPSFLGPTVAPSFTAVTNTLTQVTVAETGINLQDASLNHGNISIVGTAFFLSTIGSGPYQLPAASTIPGGIRMVSDSSTIVAEGQTCAAGSGPAAALAFSNGTIWKCF